ncbi:MAG: hypothetical protein NVSMB13_04600 [Mycobacteriales bacterium]
MAKKLSSTALLPADAAVAYGLRTSAEWITAKSAQLRDGSQLEQRAPLDDGGIELVLLRDIPADVPSLFRRFVPADGRARQRERWTPDGDGGFLVTWSLGFDGAPGSVSGRGRLIPAAEGSELRLEGEAQVGVPVIGGKAEAFLAPLVERIMQQEGDLLASLLAERS